MERSRAPCMPAKRLSIGLSAISVERDGSFFISKEEKEGLFCEKRFLKIILHLHRWPRKSL